MVFMWRLKWHVILPFNNHLKLALGKKVQNLDILLLRVNDAWVS